MATTKTGSPADNYTIIKPIGEGSFGKVFKGRRKYTGQVVALKFIPKRGKSEKDIHNFRQEIDILRRVKHENIIEMLDFFETKDEFCVVTEYADGELFEILEDDKKLPEEVVRSIAKQLVRALQYLHSNRIIHRDLKPQNILISANGIIKLCDFGFARAMSCNTIVLTSIKGTPLYMAPELVQELPYTQAVDLWSLGVILFELFTGVPPFFTNNIYSLINLIVKEHVQYPTDISPVFKDFLQGLLKKNPEERLTWPELANHRFVRETREEKEARLLRLESAPRFRIPPSLMPQEKLLGDGHVLPDRTDEINAAAAERASALTTAAKRTTIGPRTAVASPATRSRREKVAVGNAVSTTASSKPRPTGGAAAANSEKKPLAMRNITLDAPSLNAAPPQPAGMVSPRIRENHNTMASKPSTPQQPPASPRGRSGSNGRQPTPTPAERSGTPTSSGAMPPINTRPTIQRSSSGPVGKTTNGVSAVTTAIGTNAGNTTATQMKKPLRLPVLRPSTTPVDIAAGNGGSANTATAGSAAGTAAVPSPAAVSQKAGIAVDIKPRPSTTPAGALPSPRTLESQKKPAVTSVWTVAEQKSRRRTEAVELRNNSEFVGKVNAFLEASREELKKLASSSSAAQATLPANLVSLSAAIRTVGNLLSHPSDANAGEERDLLSSSQQLPKLLLSILDHLLYLEGPNSAEVIVDVLRAFSAYARRFHSANTHAAARADERLQANALNFLTLFRRLVSYAGGGTAAVPLTALATVAALYSLNTPALPKLFEPTNVRDVVSDIVDVMSGAASRLGGSTANATASRAFVSASRTGRNTAAANKLVSMATVCLDAIQYPGQFGGTMPAKSGQASDVLGFPLGAAAHGTPQSLEEAKKAVVIGYELRLMIAKELTLKRTLPLLWQLLQRGTAQLSELERDLPPPVAKDSAASAADSDKSTRVDTRGCCLRLLFTACRHNADAARNGLLHVDTLVGLVRSTSDMAVQSLCITLLAAVARWHPAEVFTKIAGGPTDELPRFFLELLCSPGGEPMLLSAAALLVGRLAQYAAAAPNQPSAVGFVRQLQQHHNAMFKAVRRVLSKVGTAAGAVPPPTADTAGGLPTATSRAASPLDGAALGVRFDGQLDGAALLLAALYATRTAEYTAEAVLHSGVWEALAHQLHPATSANELSPAGVLAAIEGVVAPVVAGIPRANLHHVVITNNNLLVTLTTLARASHLQHLIGGWPETEAGGVSGAGRLLSAIAAVFISCYVVSGAKDGTGDAYGHVLHQSVMNYDVIRTAVEAAAVMPADCWDAAFELLSTIVHADAGEACAQLVQLGALDQSQLFATALDRNTAPRRTVAAALAILSQLARTSKENYPAIHRANLYTHIQRLLYDADAEIRSKTCNLLGNLCKHNGDFYPMFIKYGYAARLLQLLRDDDRNTRKFACFAVGNAGYHSSHLYEALRPCIPALITLMGEDDDRAFISNAVGALGNLARNSTMLVRDIMAGGVLPRFVGLIEHKDRGLRRIALFALANFAVQPEAKEKLLALGVIPLVQQLIATETDSACAKSAERLLARLRS